MVLSALELFAIERWQPLAWATRRSRPRWACRSQRRRGGCSGSARTARWCRTALGDHVVRRLVCVVFSLPFSFHISRIASDLCIFSVELIVKSGARPRRFTGQRLDCIRAVLAQSPVFANVCKRPVQPQHRPRAHEGGALTSEASDMCRNPCFSLPVLFCGPPTSGASASDGAEQAAAPGVCSLLSWCSLLVWVLVRVSMMLTASCIACQLHGFRSFSRFSWLVETGPRGPIFVFSVPQMLQNTVKNEGRPI